MTAASTRHRRRVVVVGGAGYIGSVLVRRLLGAGAAVHVLDALLYDNAGALAGVSDHPGFSFERADYRDRERLRAALAEARDVVLLAALVGESICRRHPELTASVNRDAVTPLLQEAARADVERVVFASTCSNYGLLDPEELATEETPLSPLSLYAETKVDAERRVLEAAADASFAPVVLRIATAYGASERMRFDLTVSHFTRELALGRPLRVYDADTWRPYCHVRDIADAIARVLELPPDELRGEVFNVGSTGGNYTKRMIVEAAQRRLESPVAVKWVGGGADRRSYRVDFSKAAGRLGLRPCGTVERSIDGLVAALADGAWADADERPAFHGNHAVVTDALALGGAS